MSRTIGYELNTNIGEVPICTVWMDGIPDVDGISENWARVQYPPDDEPIDPRDSARADHEAQEVYDFADALVSTWNPVMDENGIGELPQTQTHPCHRRYRDVEDEDRDYAELIATVERHTRCSPAYCLRRQKRKDQNSNMQTTQNQSAGAKPLKEQDSRTSNEVNGNEEGTQSMHVVLGQSSDQTGGQVSNQESNEQTELMCRFNFPKPLASATYFEINEKRKPVLVIRRNDSRINGHNPAQLTSWRANVDMQVCTNA